jgi:hypothetical protein
MAEVEEVEALTAMVDEQNVNRISESTRKNYLRCQVVYLRWLYRMRPGLFSEIFVSEALAHGVFEEGAPPAEFIRGFLKTPVVQSKPPLHFDEFDAKRDFTFLVGLKGTAR